MKQIASALVKAQKQFAPALKTSTNPHFRSKYADLSACVEAVIDALNEHGVFLCQKTHLSDGGVTVETSFLHESGEEYSAGHFYCPANKQDAQGYGSATTYARRYALMAACGIAPEDDDGNAAVKSAPVKPVHKSELPPYSGEDFQKNLPKWIAAIKAGKMTADDIIDLVSSKGTLSKDQKAIIASVPVKEAA